MVLTQGRAPDFAAIGILRDQEIRIDLNDYRGGYVILIFYPFDEK